MTDSLDCSKCGRVCKDRKGLSRHESSCNPHKDLSCSDPDCRKIFSTISNLYKHMRSCKVIKKKKIESQQDSSSENEQSDQDNESSRVEKKGNDTKDFLCPDPDCGKTFTAKSSLIRHLQTCKEIKNKQVQSQQDSSEDQNKNSSHVEEKTEQPDIRESTHAAVPGRGQGTREKSSFSEKGKDSQFAEGQKSTYIKFTHAIEYALLPRFKEWIHLSFYNFGCRLANEMKGYYRLGSKSREENYILVQDDSRQYKKVYSDELQEFIEKAVTSSLFNGETNGIVVYVLRECSIFDQDDVQRYLNYFDEPTEEQTQEIMRGMVSL